MIQKCSINTLFKKHQWKNLAELYQPDEIAHLLPFKDALRVAYQLLYNDAWDYNLQAYAITLLYKIRDIYPDEWNSSYEYDALLGLACHISSYRHEERYEAYKRAFDKADNPPPELLIQLARCCICPGKPPISYDQALQLIQQAIKEVPYADGISLMCHIYSLKGDEEKKNYWSRILKNVDEEFISPSIEPKFLVEAYLQDLNEKKKNCESKPDSI